MYLVLHPNSEFIPTVHVTSACSVVITIFSFKIMHVPNLTAHWFMKEGSQVK